MILAGETPDAAHIPKGCRFHPRCPVAFDRCRVEEPPLFDVGGDQKAACWLAEPGGADEGRGLAVVQAPVAETAVSEAATDAPTGMAADPVVGGPGGG